MKNLKVAVAILGLMSMMCYTTGCGQDSTKKTEPTKEEISNEENPPVEPAGSVASDKTEDEESSETEETTQGFTLDPDSQALLDKAESLREQMDKSLGGYTSDESNNSNSGSNNDNNNNGDSDKKIHVDNIAKGKSVLNDGSHVRVGKDRYGFIDIPDDWVNFKEIDSSADLLQYSDKSTKSVLTLCYYDADGLNSLQAANNFVTALYESDGVEQESITCATVNLGVDRLDAYQVYCFYPADSQFLVAHFFDGEDGKVHYLAIEGDDMEVFNLADTYTLTDK